MIERFFFITNYDCLSASLIGNVLNEHTDIHCSVSFNDPFLIKAPVPEATNVSIVDNFISINSNHKRFNGNIARFASFELQNRTLTEKTKSSYRRVNITLSPYNRINFLMSSWITSAKSAEFAVTNIEHKLATLRNVKNDLTGLYGFNSIYDQVIIEAQKANVDLRVPSNKLFLFALAKVVCFDSADLPTSSKMFSFEEITANEDSFIHFVKYLTSNKINYTAENRALLQIGIMKAREVLERTQNTELEIWQTNLIEKFIHSRLRTIYYPHIDKPLSVFYSELGYKLENKNKPKLFEKLISIQLNSNRPTQLNSYFDNIEETADHPEIIEVLVNIDDNDSTMEKLLIDEQSRRKFTLKFIKTPRPISFCDLWKPINSLLEHTDPHSYFLLNISDEMLFATKGWDSILQKYVGYFPDHIFRLRGSRNKFRNYFDRWECSFGQDSIPITTKRWIEIGGDWNPCFGPDSFQQLIAFYLAKEGAFSATNYLRELPLIDIKFHGDIPGLGIEKSILWRHTRDHIEAMQICQSYRMQLEAKRRAILLKANIIAAERQLINFEIVDNKKSKLIYIIDKDTKRVLYKSGYKLNRFSIFFTNQYRKLRFNSYFGGGFENKTTIARNFLAYLKAKYKFFFTLYNFSYAPLRTLHHLNYLRKGGNLVEENKRLKVLYKIAQLENEKLQNKLNEQTTST